MFRVLRERPRDLTWTLLLWVFLILGFVIGMLMRLRPQPYTSREAMYIRVTGELWVNAVRAVALPLLVTTLACAVSDLKFRNSIKLGGFVLLWIVVSKVEVCLLAVLFSAAAQPGRNVGNEATVNVGSEQPPIRVSLGDCVMDLFRDVLPDNPVEACVRHKPTMLLESEFNTTIRGEGDPYHYKPDKNANYIYQADLLGVVMGSVTVGVAMAFLSEEVTILKELSESIRDSCIIIVRWLLVFGGPFVALVVIAELAGAQDMGGQMTAMKSYVWTVIVTYAIQILFIYPVVYVVVAARWRFLQPFQLLWALSESFVVAVGSQSAHVAYPFAYKALVHMDHTNPLVAEIVLGITSAVNNDGTGVLVTAAVLWAKQRDDGIMEGFYFSAMGLGVLGSIGAAGESSLHPQMIVMAMTTLGATTRPENVAPLLAVAWLMDSLASAVNILSSAFIAAIFGSLYENDEKFRATEEEPDEEELSVE